VDPNSAAQTVVGSIGINLNSIAFDVVTSQLYGADNSILYRIDPDTAVVTSIGATGLQVQALGFDLSGKLFGVGGNSVVLLTVNTSTGAATAIGMTGINEPQIAIRDLAVRPEDGVMFAASQTATNFRSLFQINSTTGLATTVAGPISGYGFVGLAFGPAVPEPSTLLLAAVGLPLLLRRRR
jgi:hypothetical protein